MSGECTDVGEGGKDGEGQVDPDIMRKIQEWTDLKDKFIYFNDLLISSRSYLNPRIMERMIKYLKINECGTNFPKSKFDPEEYTMEAFHLKMGAAKKREAHLRSETHNRKSSSSNTSPSKRRKFTSPQRTRRSSKTSRNKNLS